MSQPDDHTISASFVKAERGDKNILDAIERRLREQIFGQERAIEAVMRTLNRARFGFSAGNQHRPLACLLFLGPTGVGKTETARCLARLLRADSREAFLKIDCSLFSKGHEVSALVGAPPSYIGRDQKPMLDPEIIEQPNSVVLFDEIEKGTSELWNLLLQVMEDGELLLLNGGRRVSFRNSIVIFTSNVGAQEMIDFLGKRVIGFRTPNQDVEATGKQIYQIGFEALQKVFTPEWINRLDEIIAFRPLASDALGQVLDRMLLESNQQYLRYGLQVELTSEAREYFLQQGFDARFGARPLRQRLLKELDANLADLLASGGIPHGSRVLVVATGSVQYGEALEFYYEPAPELLDLSERLRAAEARQRRRKPDDAEGPSIGLAPGQEESGEERTSTTGTRATGIAGKSPWMPPRPVDLNE
ncbi:MAG: ATP-dependent Clp protease ATP-binding subunit [Chloroflexaceae bacterium]|nr:ATP-dependent Clp protease ATP-binding subunit [Chloroflexaceae bacterium]NJO04946.1 ATP-dependent Clp protease ATP-binding subunit [Chloroflexaceae bacterium]